MQVSRPVNVVGWALALSLSAIFGCSTVVQPKTTGPTQPEPSPLISQSSSGPSTTSALTRSAHYQTKVLVENLEHPWGLAWLPDGALLITERPGRLRIVRNGVLDPKPIQGLPSVFAENQGGLLDLALHPNFAKNRWVYFTYAHGTEAANQTRVARAIFDGQSLKDWQVIFEATPLKPRGQHFGSRLAWLPDGTLLVSIGDGGNPPLELEGELIRQQAQKLQSHLGKILRLKEDGSIPPDNPFVSSPQAKAAIWSYGHRNIQALTVDPMTKRVWATEHGSRGGDELNLIEAGKNYGWPVATHSREYSGGLISPEKSLPGMVDPKLVWTPSIAPSGLTVYTGKRFVGWQGHLFAGGLVSQDIRRLEVNGAGEIVKQESIPIGQRVRDIRQGPDGLLYVLTDEVQGQLLRLEPLTPEKSP